MADTQSHQHTAQTITSPVRKHKTLLDSVSGYQEQASCREGSFQSKCPPTHTMPYIRIYTPDLPLTNKMGFPNPKHLAFQGLLPNDARVKTAAHFAGWTFVSTPLICQGNLHLLFLPLLASTSLQTLVAPTKASDALALSNGQTILW